MNATHRHRMLVCLIFLLGFNGVVHGQETTAQRTLEKANRELFDKCIMDLRAKVETWRQIGRMRPNEPVWNQLANDTQKHLDKLAATPVQEDDLNKWWTADEGALAAFYKGIIYLDDNFAEGGRMDQSQRRWNYLERTNPEEYNRQRQELRHDIAGRASVLAHEAVHAAGDKSETNAYLFQYRYLVAADVPFTNDEMFKVLDQLIARGVVEYKGDRTKLFDTTKIDTTKIDKQLGLDIVKKYLEERKQEKPTGQPEPERPKKGQTSKPKELVNNKPEEPAAPPKLGQPDQADWDKLKRRVEQATKRPVDDDQEDATLPVIPSVCTIDAVFADPDDSEHPYRWSFYLRDGEVSGNSPRVVVPAIIRGDNGQDAFSVQSKFVGESADNVLTGTLKQQQTPVVSWANGGSEPWRMKTIVTNEPFEMTVTLSGDGTAMLNISAGSHAIRQIILQGMGAGKTFDVTHKTPAQSSSGVWQYRESGETAKNK